MLIGGYEPNGWPNNAEAAPAPAGHARASPARDTPSARPASAAVVEDTPTHARGWAKEDKILETLEALFTRMECMKTSQIRIDEDERMRGSIESGLIAFNQFIAPDSVFLYGIFVISLESIVQFLRTFSSDQLADLNGV